MNKIPKHILRFRSQPMTVKEKISKAQKQSEQRRAIVKISLKNPPWFNQDQKANQ